jgi:hypothetical protein
LETWAFIWGFGGFAICKVIREVLLVALKFAEMAILKDLVDKKVAHISAGEHCLIYFVLCVTWSAFCVIQDCSCIAMVELVLRKNERNIVEGGFEFKHFHGGFWIWGCSICCSFVKFCHVSWVRGM